LNNNKLINEKLICAFHWSVLPSIMKMHGPKNKTYVCIYICMCICICMSNQLKFFY